jgi:hypothetical protein
MSTLGAAEGMLMVAETEANWWPVSSHAAVVVGTGILMGGADGIGVEVVDAGFEVELAAVDRVVLNVLLDFMLIIGLLVLVTGAVTGALVNKMGVCAGARYVYPNMPPAPRVG